MKMTRHKCTDCGAEFTNVHQYYRHRTKHSATRPKGRATRDQFDRGQPTEGLPRRGQLEETNRPGPERLELEFLASQNRTKSFKRRKGIEVLQDFAENTTLHGIKYLTKRVSVVEKIFWIVTFLASFAMCTFVIYSVWSKWRYSPVFVPLNDRLVSVGEIPFPSVTICKSFNCDQTRIEHPEYWNDTKDKRMDLPTFCKWRGQHVSCDQIFSEVFTNEGQCYNFNGLSFLDILEMDIQKEHLYFAPRTRIHGWSPSYGYEYTSDGFEYPLRGQVRGPYPDLEIELGRDDECKSKNVTFKIYLQHPNVLPQTSNNFYTSVLDELTTLSLTYKVLNTSENFNYSPKVRQCYYPFERKLRYFKIYSPENCELECISDITYSYCGCVSIYMLHDYLIPPLCKRDLINCTIEAQDLYLKLSRGMIAGACECLPSCLSINYEAEVTKSYFDSHITTKLNGDRYAKIQMYFKESRVMSMRRWDLGLREYGLVDFLANCGGLLGLFLGFSSLSLVEIFYFLTLRIWCALKRDSSSQ